MKLASWNVNSLKIRLPQLLEWLAASQPDVVCLQETKLEDHNFPREEIEAAGYEAAFFGQKTYNGVALLSRHGLNAITLGNPHFEDEQKRLIAATVGTSRVICAYMPNGQSVGSDKYHYKLNWLQALTDWLQDEMVTHPQLVLAGDFNIAPEDRDSYDPVGLAETIHHTTEEREHFKALLGLGLTDAFRLFEQPEKSYSWWDYRMLGFQKNRGLRIDHILVSQALRAGVTACHVDRAPRKNPQPSDHAPVVATLG